MSTPERPRPAYVPSLERRFGSAIPGKKSHIHGASALAPLVAFSVIALIPFKRADAQQLCGLPSFGQMASAGQRFRFCVGTNLDAAWGNDDAQKLTPALGLTLFLPNRGVLSAAYGMKLDFRYNLGWKLEVRPDSSISRPRNVHSFRFSSMFFVMQPEVGIGSGFLPVLLHGPRRATVFTLTVTFDEFKNNEWRQEFAGGQLFYPIGLPRENSRFGLGAQFSLRNESSDTSGSKEIFESLEVVADLGIEAGPMFFEALFVYAPRDVLSGTLQQDKSFLTTTVKLRVSDWLNLVPAVTWERDDAPPPGTRKKDQYKTVLFLQAMFPPVHGPAGRDR